jgi:hypothetical protein
MDRIDAMRVFIAALGEGSLAGAGRLGRSPAAVSRAMALLERQVGAPLLHRTTRAIRRSTLPSIGHIARLTRVLDNYVGYVDPLGMLSELREDNM